MNKLLSDESIAPAKKPEEMGRNGPDDIHIEVQKDRRSINQNGKKRRIV
jgi:hypothetical protein